MSDPILWALAGLITLVVVVLAVDRWQTPIPFVRTYGPILLALLGGLFTLGLLSKNPPDPNPKKEPIPPKEFDDEPERELDKEADDTDLEVVAADRAADDADDRADDRDAELADLRAELDSLQEGNGDSGSGADGG